MNSTITLSQMADLIIVTCFFTAGYTALLYLVSEAIIGLISIIKAKQKAKKERKEKELNQTKNK